MSIYLTDLIAVERNGTSYKETYGNRINIGKSDALLVEATTTAGGRVVGNKYQCARYEWDGGGHGSATGIPASAPVSGDLLLVERPSVTLASRADPGDTSITVDPIHTALSSGTTLVFLTSFGAAFGLEVTAAFTLTSSASIFATTLTGTAGLKCPSGDSVPIGRDGGVLYKVAQTEWGRYTDIHSANYPINTIATLYGETRNNLNNFSVVEVQVEVSSSASSAEGDLYIGFRNTAPTEFYGDLDIAAVQILEADGTTVRVTSAQDCTWNFADGNTTAGYSSWATTTDQNTKTLSQILASDPSAAPGGYSAISTTNTKWKFSYTENRSIGSSYVNAKRGIPTLTYTGNPASTAILPVGIANVPQSAVTTDGFIYVECTGSGVVTNDVTWLGLYATGLIHNGDRIRICYFGGGNGGTASNGLQPANSLFLRFIEDP